MLSASDEVAIDIRPRMITNVSENPFDELDFTAIVVPHSRFLDFEARWVRGLTIRTLLNLSGHRHARDGVNDRRLRGALAA